ncbi:rhomboid family intramembrane serine protease [Chryseobacterium gambrini]|uniref:Rhomboid family intramembrane serine protease n=1 Tax=Chryseobacterium gambrini TaxID=373672 RepID=A0AAJ1VLX3_9FLAO|nr:MULTISPECIES: rhomboid family intramembrane serine protease [Chryseobacterium]MDN4012124.1 rhomboid family intramembrane serine protease [Chryseobacterium gambrini]MDN4029642.1 rhomboid family intramembrane serine protease [Chryseobacterium gambrini]QWA37070.1 rhomboid family intramembrane serine protease [Chryseobacterium sp. ZHDP1]
MFNSIPPVTRNIIIINVAVFVIANLLFQDRFVGYLAAFYPFSPFFKSWQIVTHMFMHGSFMHILFNMFTLFSFGPILENSLGEKKYLILYFLSGLGAFFLFNLWNFVEVQQISSELQQLGFNLNEYLSGSSVQYSGSSQAVLRQQELVGELNGIMGTPMVGASGAIFGVVAAFATLYPDAKIGIMFIPIPMKVKYVLPVVVIGSIYLGVSGNGGGIAHLAHVGGAIVGFILARIWRKHLYRFN